MLSSLDTSKMYNQDTIAFYSKYVLVSFWYMKDNTHPYIYKLIEKRNKTDDFILDSGAFSMFNAYKDGVTEEIIDNYVTEYIAFIKKYKIKRYIELDIDSVVGYKKVKQIRERLEREIGWKCMPVWHVSRGIDEFKKHVDEYDYITIGGLAINNISKKEYPKLKELNAYARKRGVKVHGLGFTGKDAFEYGFYSVDSSSWTSGGRFGTLFKFNGKNLDTFKAPEGKRVHNEKGNAHNYIEWCKWQRHLEREQK